MLSYFHDHQMPIRSLHRTIAGVQLTLNPMLIIAEVTIYPDSKRCPSPEVVIPAAQKQQAQLLPRHKIVTFFQIVTIKAHEHFRDMSLEEREATWYKKENYVEMKRECIPAVRLMIKGVYPGDSDVLCKRGVEYRTPAGSKLRKKNQRDSVQAVISAQDLDQDDESIRSEYIKLSALEQLNAQKVGYEDALEAAALYNDDFREMGVRCHDSEISSVGSFAGENTILCHETYMPDSACGKLRQLMDMEMK